MTISNDVLIQITVLILAVIGFFVALHIYRKKKKHSPLVCPIRFDCNTVINSDYSRFFGIPVEILGMIYYGFVAASYLFLIFLTSAFPFVLAGVLVAASTAAFVFSLYLMFVQFVILKKGCSWCIFSAVLCILIFVLTISGYNIVQLL